MRTTHANLKGLEHVRANKLMEEVEFLRTTPNDPSFLYWLLIVDPEVIVGDNYRLRRVWARECTGSSASRN